MSDAFFLPKQWPGPSEFPSMSGGKYERSRSIHGFGLSVGTKPIWKKRESISEFRKDKGLKLRRDRRLKLRREGWRLKRDKSLRPRREGWGTR